MPSGRTVGSKLMSRTGLVSSLWMASMVMVPTSICWRSAGHWDAACAVGSPGWPTITIRCQCNGAEWICAITASNIKFLSGGGVGGGAEPGVAASAGRGVGRGETLIRLSPPAYRSALAFGVDEAKRVQSVVGAVAESRSRRIAAEYFQRRLRFRVRADEGASRRAVYFARAWIGRSCHQKSVKILRIVDRENRDVDHAGAPFFAVRCFEKQREAANVVRAIGGKRHSARERKATDQRHAPRLEYLGLGKRLALAVALKVAGDANSLSVVPAESIVHSVQVLESIDHRGGSERVRGEPAARVQEKARNHGDHYADGRQPPDCALPLEGRRRRLRDWIRLAVWHFASLNLTTI